MAWLRNHYQCYRCDYEWADEWSCQCDDDCPVCGARHASPVESEDLTTIVERENGHFVVYFSSEDAEEEPDYVKVGVLLTYDLARAFANAYAPDQLPLGV